MLRLLKKFLGRDVTVKVYRDGTLVRQFTMSGPIEEAHSVILLLARTSRYVRCQDNEVIVQLAQYDLESIYHDWK